MAYPTEVDAVVVAPSGATTLGGGTPTHTVLHNQYRTALLSIKDRIDTVVARQINAQTGTTYTIAAADVTKLVTLSNASAITLTWPQDSAVTVAIGASVDLVQIGAGQVTNVAGAGATVNTEVGMKFRAQWAVVTGIKIAANTWLLVGGLSA